MAVIQVQNLSFTYEGSPEPVFSDLSFHMDSSWRLGLVGRNGRGKTTLLRLMAGQLQGQGQVISALPFDLFPFDVEADRPARKALIDARQPYTAWEKEMADCLALASPEAIARYGDIEQRYAASQGYIIRDLLAKEAALLGFDQEDLGRPFSSFSPGEQTRLKLAALFLLPGHFLLIDEPTNHLDSEGRQLISDYLRKKSGFLAVSHDRDLLDSVCDHILALEKQGARLVTGNYSTYRENKRLQDQHEREQQAALMADIRRLQGSAREKSAWSDKIEATKIGHGPCDRGFIGAQAAKMMRKAKAIETRIQRQITEKEQLLKNLEYTSPLKLQPVSHPAPYVLRLQQLSFSYGSTPLLTGITLTLKPGERLALTGPNGCGKSTLFKLILGELQPTAGSLTIPRGLTLSHLPQTAAGLAGTPRELAQGRGLDLSLFFTLLRKFDLPQAHFDRDVTTFSLGQRKKTLLSLSLAQPAQLYLWDEPLNDIDPESREQIEDMLLETQATMVVIEHERTFINRVATRELRLGEQGP